MYFTGAEGVKRALADAPYQSHVSPLDRGPVLVSLAKVQSQEIVHRIFSHPIGPGCIQAVNARSLPCLGRTKFALSRDPYRVFHELILFFTKINT